MARSSAVIGSRTPPTVRRGSALDNGWEDACSEARAAHRILGSRADGAAAAASWCWRPSGSATTRVWTAEAYGSDAATILAWLAQATSDDQARLGDLPDARPLGGDDGDDRGDDRPALRRADAARDRLERPAGGRGLARAAVRPAAAAHARVRGGRADGAGARARGLRRRDACSCRCPTGRARRSSSRSRPSRSGSRSTSPRSGPKNTTLAAEISDGWLPTLFSPEHVGEFRPLLEEGFARAGGGKGFDDFDIVPTVTAMVSDDLESARDAMRHYVALYVGGMGSRKQNFYNALVQRYGFEDGGARRSRSCTWRAARTRPRRRCRAS